MVKLPMQWVTRGEPGHPLRYLGLLANADRVAILSVSGGRRATDIFEVFPELR